MLCNLKVIPLPFPHNLLKVKVSSKPFIYIASQAPLQSTVSDFLQMVCEQNVKIIVMLYNKKVSKKKDEKVNVNLCTRYTKNKYFVFH